jgi:hypothetical protein
LARSTRMCRMARDARARKCARSLGWARD